MRQTIRDSFVLTYNNEEIGDGDKFEYEEQHLYHKVSDRFPKFPLRNNINVSYVSGGHSATRSDYGRLDGVGCYGIANYTDFVCIVVTEAGVCSLNEVEFVANSTGVYFNHDSTYTRTTKVDLSTELEVYGYEILTPEGESRVLYLDQDATINGDILPSPEKMGAASIDHKHKECLTVVEKTVKFPLEIQYSLYSAKYVNGMHFVGADYLELGYANYSSGFMLSKDGFEWEAVNIGSHIYDAAYGNGIYVLLGADKKAYVSQDGAEWTSYAMPDEPWKNIIFANGKFFALAQTSDIERIAYSEDGMTWTAITAGITMNYNSFNTLIYGAGKFAAFTSYSAYPGTNWNTGMLYSEDGVSWEVRTEPMSVSFAAFGNNKFVAVNNGSKVAVSEDLVNWEYFSFPEGNQYWDSLIFAQDRFVLFDADGRVAFSNDGLNWDFKEISGHKPLQKTYFAGDKFFTVSKEANGGLFSFDGIHWRERTAAFEMGGQDVSNLVHDFLGGSTQEIASKQYVDELIGGITNGSY